MTGTGSDGSDETVVVRRSGRARRRGPALAGVAVALVLAICGAALSLHLPLHQPAGTSAPHVEFAIRPAGEAEILADRPSGLTIFRFVANPRVLVLDFASLEEQGRMLNRVAALVEKAGLPRDRVVDEAELDAAIRASGDTPATWYYGHDYRAADIVRFFFLAAIGHVALRPEEERLRRLAEQEGWFGGAPGALISIPAVGADKVVDLSARATILHHELSHGEYFTDPVYAAYTHHVWDAVLTAQDRDLFRRFLGAEGYDTAQDDLMMNEMQAYLMHTPDPVFFTPQAVGMTAGHVRELRDAFLKGMPPGWLRDETTASPAMVPAASRQ